MSLLSHGLYLRRFDVPSPVAQVQAAYLDGRIEVEQFERDLDWAFANEEGRQKRPIPRYLIGDCGLRLVDMRRLKAERFWDERRWKRINAAACAVEHAWIDITPLGYGVRLVTCQRCGVREERAL